jgi:predicted nucleic acid-binding Zn ribbon protein
MNGNQCCICGAPMGEGDQVCKTCLKTISEPARSLVKAKIVNMLMIATRESVFYANQIRDLTLKLAEMECEG